MIFHKISTAHETVGVHQIFYMQFSIVDTLLFMVHKDSLNIR
jgi:hypothetical protein